MDSNHQPSAYETDELTSCSTPLYEKGREKENIIYVDKNDYTSALRQIIRNYIYTLGYKYKHRV